MNQLPFFAENLIEKMTFAKSRCICTQQLYFLAAITAKINISMIFSRSKIKIESAETRATFLIP